MKTLLGGCSFSDWCGFGTALERPGLPPLGQIGNHKDPRCWYNIVKNQCNLELTNVSYGGFSNEEILASLTRQVMLDDYDLVLFQTTSIGRKWFYRSHDPFDFCMIHGTNIHDKHEKEMFEYLRVNFNNELIEYDRTLSNILLLQRYLDQRNTPLILINGINFGYAIKSVLENIREFWADYIPDHKWNLKGKMFTENLVSMSSQIDTNNMVAYETSFNDLAVDLADDQLHPGEKSNQLFAELVAQQISKIKL